MGFKAKAGAAIGGLVVVLGGAAVASSMMDANWLRTRLVTAVERQTGRQLRIDTLHVWLLPYPWVDAKGVGLTDIPNGGQVEMFTAQEVRARLALLPLFSHRVVLDDVSLMHPTLGLERTEDGRANWLFTPNAPQNPSSPAADTTAHAHWKVALASVHVRNGTLSWSDRTRRLSGTADVDQVDVTGLTGDTVSLDVRGHHASGAFTLAGTTGPMPPAADVAWPVHLSASLAIDKKPVGLLHVDGTVKNPMQDTGYDLHVDGTLDELRSLDAVFPHANLPEAQGLSLDAVVTGSGKAPSLAQLHLHTGAVDLDHVLTGLHASSMAVDAAGPSDKIAVTFDGDFNDQRLSARGTLGTLDETQRAARDPDANALPVNLALVDGESSLKLNGTVGGGHTDLDLHGALPTLIFGAGKPSLSGLKVDGHASSGASVTLLQRPDPVALIRAVQANLDVTADRVTWQSVAWNDTTAHVTIDKGTLTADPIKGNGSGVTQAGRVSYDVSGDTPHLTASASPLVLPAEAIEAWAKLPGLVSGSLQVVGSVAADGTDAQAWRTSLTGHIGVSMVGGRVSGAALSKLIGQGLPVHGALGLRCFGTHIQLGGQQATLDPLGMEADLFSMGGHGTVNLATNALDLHLTPRIGIGGASASSPVGIGGTLDAPAPHLEQAANGRFGITIGGQSDQTDPCPALLAAAREGGAGPAAGAPPMHKGNKLMDLLKGFMH